MAVIFKYINLKLLSANSAFIKSSFQSRKPFRYVVFDDFFLPEMAEAIYAQYPSVDEGVWDATTYIDQKRKFQQNTFPVDTIFSEVFSELNSIEFMQWLKSVTELEEDLIADDELFGGGLHQSVSGAFLNVHVDYNIHPKTKLHRRLNVLVYMNKDWRDEYEGHLELWDFADGKKILIESVAPAFNRCVIFETNEVSYHGHPKPLKTPRGVSRKSLAAYYYTKSRPPAELAEDHNSVFVNTEGVAGQLKRLQSGLRALFERLGI